jgi:acyl-CoA synthetase (AMP-forming)/AMP-acid ligase II
MFQSRRTAFVFVDDPGEHGIDMSYGELVGESGRLAQHIRTSSTAGDRIILALQSNRHFVVAFFACLLAGTVPVPAVVPRREALSRRFSRMIEDSAPTLGICDAPAARQACGAGLPWLDPGRLPDAPQADASWRADLASVARTGLALLQYTSGSTADPKGVMVTHENVMSNCAAIAHAFRNDESSVGAIALPLFHDMGLIGGILQPVYAGFPMQIMNPAHVIQKPANWLRRISTERVTVSGGPNFLFEWASLHVKDEELRGLDLSSWQVAFCGAEPVRGTTVERFCARFGPAGFRRSSFCPCYGLAEATLFVAGGAVGDAPAAAAGGGPGSQEVSCGDAALATSIRLVDPATGLEVPAGAEGEVWVSGPGVAAGYWRQPEQSGKVFSAMLPGEAGPAFLRTGDLGRLRDGQLHISGRLKDLIILRGRNIAPQDIECEAERGEAGPRIGSTAAFTAERDGSESLVLLAELDRRQLHRPDAWTDLKAGIRSAVSAACQLKVDDVVLLLPGALPRTSSGKVRRHQCRLDYLAGVLAVAQDRAIATRTAPSVEPSTTAACCATTRDPSEPPPLRTAGHMPASCDMQEAS